ncbi:MAG TPA: tripartite tricarboxylate transporter TctB family protein [Usitatibacter sp.]|nr:tripartite tricarboxylate transporter TctB family protein [Usitatibacter sp.]
MEQGEEGRAVGSVRVWEVIVALGFLAFGALVVWDSRRLGSQWASDGPQAGYFPFYIGLIICIASVINLLRAINLGAAGRKPFVLWGQLRMVLIVMVPCALYVALIANPVYGLGIYEASAIFIALFMRLLGKYGWGKAIAVGIGTMFVFFLMFEVWFQVPLPKGPIEGLLGFR